MQLEFTDDQDALRDSVRSVLAKECPIALVRAHVERVVRGERSTAGTELFRALAALDWTALTVPDAHGGVGLGVIELAVLAEELGRAMALGPLLPTVAGFVPLVREAGGADWLESVASGELRCTAALSDDGAAWSPEGVAARVDEGGMLSGTKRYVVGVEEVDEIAVVVRRAPGGGTDGGTAGAGGGGGLAVAVVPASAVSITSVRSLDPSRSVGHVALDGARVDRDRLLPITAEGLDRAAAEVTVAFALELVGTCQTIFDTVLQYAKERYQFGVPIGSFQAVKHKLANMFVAIERARAVALFAAATIEEGDDRRPMATAMAKAAAGECQALVAQDGIQLLGGIGYTWEHDQQLFVKRAKAADLLFGNASDHRARVAALLGL